MTAAVATDNTQTNTVVSHNYIFESIQNALPECLESGDVDHFIQIFDGKISESVKVSVETAVRYYVMNSLYKGNDTDLSKIIAVAKLIITLTRKELCLPTLSMLVLSDAFDSLTVLQCEKLFSFVEGSVSIWKEPVFFAPSKNQVLRMCNDVLRRLSRSQNTIFCGRILLFLARFFPFSERSGLNLISEFNLENVTTYSTTADNEDPMEVSEVKDEDDDTKDIKPPKIETKSPSLDHTLYTKFWSLQDYFRNPIQCYQKQPWQQFIAYTTDVLEAFSSFKLEASQQKDKKSPHNYTNAVKEAQVDLDRTLIDTLPDVKKIDQYFAKFLTNQRLLDLQFSDSNFRRYVLLQLLVVFHYLCSSIKFKQETLGPSELEWVKATESKVYTLLKETPPDGEIFVTIVKRTLEHEDQWNEWKNSGCPEIKKPPADMSAPAVVVANGSNGHQNGKHETDTSEEDTSKPSKRGRKRKLGEIIREAESKKKFVMANAEMTRLWNICSDNSEATRLSKRDFTPSLDDYFKKAVEQVMSGEELPAGDKLVSDSDFGWRGLRILACRSPHFFTHSTAPIATLPEYLTTMIKKLAKDMPAVNGQPKQSSGQQSVASQQQTKQEEKVIPDQSDEVEDMEGGEDEPEEESTSPHEELQSITKEEQESLAASLVKLTGDTWRDLTTKLGFLDDEVDYILGDKGGKVQPCIEHFLQLWVENEGDEANKEAMVYILGGLQMSAVAEDALK